MSVKAMGAILAVIGLTLSEWLGGWDMPLKILIALLVADYITGLLKAIRSKSVTSEVMFWGGVRKGIIIGVVYVCVMLDHLVGNASPVFRTMALYYYIGMEGLSVVENLGTLGVPLPSFLAGLLQQLQQKGESQK